MFLCMCIYCITVMAGKFIATNKTKNKEHCSNFIPSIYNSFCLSHPNKMFRFQSTDRTIFFRNV